MARNRFDVDEKFESYNIGHLRRSMVYIRRGFAWIRSYASRKNAGLYKFR